MKNIIKLITTFVCIIILIIQCRPVDDSKLSVTLHKNSIDLVSGQSENIPFTAKDFHGEVTVTATSLPQGIIINSSFDAETGSGILIVSSSLNKESENVIPITFTDMTRQSVNANLTVKVHTKAEISLDIDSDAIYVYPSAEPYTVNYSIKNFDTKDIVIECTEGLTGKVIKTDNSSGKIEILVSESFGESENPGSVTLKAINDTETISCTVTVFRAYLNLSKTSYEFSVEGGEINIYVSSNVKYSYEIADAPEGMINVRNEGDSFIISVSENATENVRTGKVVFKDENAFFNKVFTVTQTMQKPETDKPYLMEIYYALNGPEWATEIYYNPQIDPTIAKSGWTTWITEDDIDKMGGVDDYNNDGRVDCLRLQSIEPYDLRKGTMPDAFGKLTQMKEFILYGSSVTGLPDNLGNLTNIKQFVIYCNPINIRLDTHKGLKEMFENASNGFRDFLLINCGLYGSIPEWMGNFYGGKTEHDQNAFFSLEVNYLSGQVPDKVANNAGWTRLNWVDLDRDGWFEEITSGELIMRQQGGDGSYALWVGEKPDNVKFVDDVHGGHWEWIGPNPYRDNSKYRKDYEMGEAENKGAEFYDTGLGCY